MGIEEPGAGIEFESFLVPEAFLAGLNAKVLRGRKARRKKVPLEFLKKLELKVII